MTKIREEQIISINILDRDGYGEVNANNSIITNLSDPLTDQDASTKYYVDNTHSTLSEVLYSGNSADGYDILDINSLESNDGYFYNDVEIGNNLEVNNDLIVSGDIELFSGNINNVNLINSNDGYFVNISVNGNDISVHENLTGLGNDDHTQYLLINGTRSMSGSLNMGANSIDNITTLSGQYLTLTPNDATFNFGSNDIIIGDGYIKAESSLTNYIGSSPKLSLTGTVFSSYTTDDLYLGDSTHYWKDGYFTRITLPQNVIAIGIESAISGTPAGLIGIGYQAAKSSTTASVAIGYQALSSNISGANSTAIGYSAGKAMTNNNGTFIGYNAGISCTSENIVAIGVNSLYTSAASSTASVSVGVNSLYSLASGIGNATLGYYAGFGIVNGHYNVAIGYQALQNVSTNATQMDGNIAIGVNSGLNSYSNYNIFIGYNCGSGITTGASNTILGSSAYSSGNYSNSTALGANSAITGDNQVQLGDSSTTTYAYGAVQDRSDIRDKTDVRNTLLGLNFINKLRPVDYKWNYREDYSEGDEEFSKKRKRYHHGFIAQEIKEVIDELNVDFGGYQDQLMSGGKDIKTLGYNEFIAPIIKSIQELSQENYKLKEDYNLLQKQIDQLKLKVKSIKT